MTTTRHIDVCYCKGKPTPMVGTFIIPKCELYCLECGRACGLFNAFTVTFTVNETTELMTKLEELKAEFDENVVGKYITPRAWRGTCSKCFENPGENPSGHKETHDQHATDEEWAAHEEAAAWMRHRAGKTNTADDKETTTTATGGN